MHALISLGKASNSTQFDQAKNSCMHFHGKLESLHRLPQNSMSLDVLGSSASTNIITTTDLNKLWTSVV